MLKPKLAHTGSGSSLGGQVKGQQNNGNGVCGDCGAPAPGWASVNRGILLCTECCSVHRSLGRHVSHIKSLHSGSLWIPEQLAMVQSLFAAGANSVWEYSLLNPGSHSSSHHSSSNSASKVSRSSSSLSSSTSAAAAMANFSKMKKPKPTDKLHPIKSDFIRAKHAHMAFVLRPSKEDAVSEPPSASASAENSELSRQLHSSVRTANLETSLRLLSQGADPNYFHPEKNSTPLQVAGRAGQAGQVELLLVYGADPGSVDKSGNDAAELAERSGHASLASRLSSAQYELSDRLSYFLCQKTPDHSNGQHFLIPGDPGAPTPPQPTRVDELRVAKRKLQGLNNSVFEELSIDVYDEVDRRETDAIWNAVEGSGGKNAVIIPFLPVNPDFGTTRNQGRQKLARLSNQEFHFLVTDVLKEIRRRQTEMSVSSPMKSPLRESAARSHTNQGFTKSLPQFLPGVPGVTSAGADPDDPIYDYVASDDDYYHIPEPSSLGGSVNAEFSQSNPDSNRTSGNTKRPHSGNLRHSSAAFGGGSSTATTNSSPAKSTSSASGNNGGANLNSIASTGGGGGGSGTGSVGAAFEAFHQLKAQLDNSEHKVQALIDSNDDMRNEIARLTDTVNKLVEENQSLKLHPPGGHHQYHSLPFNANSASPPGGGGEQHYASVGPPANAATASPVRRASPGPGGGKQAPPAPPLRSGQTVSMYERPVSRGSSGGGGAPGLQQQPQQQQPLSLPSVQPGGGSFMTLHHPPSRQQPPGSPFSGTNSSGSSRLAAAASSPASKHSAMASFSPMGPSSCHPDDQAVKGSLHPPPPYNSSTLSLPPTTTGLPTYPITSNKFDFSNNLPGQEEVVRRTEAITRCIQELLISAKDEKFDAFIPCSEGIVRAVTDMVALFPGTSHTVPGEADRGGGVGEDVESTPLMPNDSVYDALATLTDAANHFETECRILIMRSQKEPLHQSFVTQQVIQCAFDIAKSTKQLVAQFQ